MDRASITSLPVDPFALYDQFGWSLIKLSESEEEYGRYDPLKLRQNKCDAVTLWDGEEYLTIYDENKPPGRIRWTLAHEIGHIALSHLLNYENTSFFTNYLSDENYKTLETEANYFARELLTPLWILKESKLVESDYISSVCQVTMPAARVCESVLEEHWDKAIYRESRWFYEIQFKEFLEPVSVCSSSDIDIPFGELNGRQRMMVHTKNMQADVDQNGRFVTCPDCNHAEFSLGAEYCKCCGTYLYRGNRKIKWDGCNKISTAGANYCESCGSQTYTIKKGLLQHWKELLEENGENNISIDYPIVDDQ